MKKFVILVSLFLLGFAFPCFASTGSAYDAFAFLLIFAGFLLAIVGMLWLIDLTRTRGKEMIRRVCRYVGSHIRNTFTDWSLKIGTDV
jgi:hypothetical protein